MVVRTILSCFSACRFARRTHGLVAQPSSSQNANFRELVAQLGTGRLDTWAEHFIWVAVGTSATSEESSALRLGSDPQLYHPELHDTGYVSWIHELGA